MSVQLDRQNLLTIVKTSIMEYEPDAPGFSESNLSENTVLFGGDGLLDSVGLVSVLMDIEQQLEDGYEMGITIADERAMSQKNNPFRTIGTLIDYLTKLINDSS